MVKLAMLALLCAAMTPAALALSSEAAASAKSGRLTPGLGEAARFATLRAGGSYPSGDADVTMREGLGENLPFPGSDYLGMGYNALYGNPDGDGEKMEDPGWRGPVLRIPWCQDAQCLSADMQYLRPTDHSKRPIGWAVRKVACDMATEMETMKSMSDYSNSLSVDASVEVEGGLFGGSAAFSASAGYSQFKQEVSEGGSTRFQIKSYCTQFTMGLPRINHKPMRDSIFSDALTGLGDPKHAHIKNQWFHFFDTFGTHVAIEIDLGGKMVMTTTADDSFQSKTSTKDMSAAVSASFDGALYSGSASLSTKTSSSAMNALRTSKKKSHVSIFGGLPPAENPVGSTEGFGEWAATVAERPMPVKYRLCQLDECAGLYGPFYRAALREYGKDRIAKLGGGNKAPAHVSAFPPTLPAPRSSWGTKNQLRCGEDLKPGEFLVSSNGKYRAGFDPMFNFMIWEKKGSLWVGKWQTRTGRKSGSGVDRMSNHLAGRRTGIRMVMGTFCRLHMVDEHGVRFWSSANGNKYEVCKKSETGALIMANDGLLYILTHWGTGRWQSGTSMTDREHGKYWFYGNAVKDKKLFKPGYQSACARVSTDWRWGCDDGDACS